MNSTEEKIIRKALQYFSENDYQNASLNSIASAIGITKGGIYHYFSSKEDLLKKCILYFFDMMKEMLEDMVDTEREPSLEELVGSFFALDQMFEMIALKMDIDFLSDYAAYIYLLFTGIKKFPELKGVMTGIYSESKEGLKSQLMKFQERGQISADVDCDAFTVQLLALSEGYMLFAAIDENDTLNIRKSSEEIVKNLVRSLK